MVFGLGGLNLFGVIILGTMLKYVLHMMHYIINLLSIFFVSMPSLLFFIAR